MINQSIGPQDEVVNQPIAQEETSKEGPTVQVCSTNNEGVSKVFWPDLMCALDNDTFNAMEKTFHEVALTQDRIVTCRSYLL